VFDGMAAAHIADRQPILFDRLESWEERNAAEHRTAKLIAAIREHPVVGAIESHGYPLLDFAEPRLRIEIVRLLRGWTLASAGAGARELVCDPGAPAALLMGARAGLGFDPSSVSYTVPSALPGSRVKRALARPLMRALATRSRPERVRVAAVVAGKLSLALASLSSAELHAAGIGAMPFPGLDHGNGALLALRRRLPLLSTYGASRAGPGPEVSMPERLDLLEAAELDRVLTLLLGQLLAGTAAEFTHAVGALAGLGRASSLQALLLSNTGYGASRLLIKWAHERGLRVGSMQHGIYSLQEVQEGERQADIVFGWGDATVEQTLSWPAPRPRVLPVGLPGAASPPAGVAAHQHLSRALIATSDTVDMPLAPSAFCEIFIDVITPGLKRLAAAGVTLVLRPHPNEDPARYRRLLSARGLDIGIVARGPFSASAADADIMISSASSVAFEAAALRLPVLLWAGGAPQWIRREHFVPPWAECIPGMFETSVHFDEMVDNLLRQPDAAFELAHGLARRLARYTEPFRPDRFAAGLHALCD
jgi:hypothetical protein